MAEKLVICEVVSEFDDEFDGSLCRVTKVLCICNTQQEADAAYRIFDPSRYGNYDTNIRIVPESQLDERFR